MAIEDDLYSIGNAMDIVTESNDGLVRSFANLSESGKGWTVFSRLVSGSGLWRLQNKVRDLLLETFSDLEPDDIRSAIMGETGEDIKLSPAARRLIPYSFECKNQEKINIWDSLQQAEENCGVYDPVLIFKRNRSKTYAVINIEKFIELINENNKPTE